MRRTATAFLAALLALAVPATLSRSILPKKMTGPNGGKEFHFDAAFPNQLCAAVVSEMHIEVLMHKLQANGEDDVYETAGLAVCLGVVQNYTLTLNDRKRYTLIKAPDGLDEDEKEKFLLHDIEAALVVKETCALLCDEGQQEISEVMYRRSPTETAEAIAADFCPSFTSPKKKSKPFNPKTRTEEPYEEPSETKAPKSQRAFDNFLRDKDTGGVIAGMMETEMHHPERMLPDDAQQLLNEAKEGSRCHVCKKAVQEAFAKAKEEETTPRFKDKWQRDSLITDIVTRVCHGKDFDRIQEGYFPSVAGNPPEWETALGVKHVLKGDKEEAKYPMGWKIYRYKGDQSAAAVNAAEKLGYDISTYGVFKTALLTQTCRKVIDERQADEDLAEMILEGLSGKPSKVFREYCKEDCKVAKKGHWHDEL